MIYGAASMGDSWADCWGLDGDGLRGYAYDRLPTGFIGQLLEPAKVYVFAGSPFLHHLHHSVNPSQHRGVDNSVPA